jgi:PEP-CTERM motif
MNKFLRVAMWGVATLPGMVVAQGHVHTALCNHQWTENQGSFAAAPSFSALSAPSSTSNVSAGGMNFILNDLGGVGVGSQARAGFEAAAALWSSVLLDPITIRLDVRFAALGPNILGSTGSTTNSISYSGLRSVMQADAKSATDASAVASLQAGPLRFVTNEPPVSGPIDARTRFIDNNNTVDNNNIQINTAQVKALGLSPVYNANTNPGQRDGSVSFSTLFNWDFDRSDGIGAGLIDFVGVAAHEIGHALGFRSGVDLADANALPGRAGPNGARGLNGLAWGTVLDLFRYGEFDGVETLDWSIGGSPCMSIDAGASCVGDLSTGAFNGDGRQASHWKDDILLDTFTPLGIMDPTATGKGGLRPFMAITAADLIAFDAIGYDVAQVPEPTTWAIVLTGLGLAGVATRRRRPALAQPA